MQRSQYTQMATMLSFVLTDANAQPKPRRPSGDYAICIRYNDGLRAAVLKVGSSSDRWNFACRLKGDAKPHAAREGPAPLDADSTLWASRWNAASAAAKVRSKRDSAPGRGALDRPAPAAQSLPRPPTES